jgi:hypothetical protein
MVFSLTLEGSKKLVAHKLILSLFSPIFQSKIDPQAKVLKLEEEERFLDLLFKFVYLYCASLERDLYCSRYKGSLEKISEQEALGLLELANTYKVHYRMKKCLTLLRSY